MLSGAEVAVNTATFKNDPAKIASKDDVITYLIHLGYLGYNEDSETAFIPNEEIRQELITAVKSSNWNELIGFQEESRKLLYGNFGNGYQTCCCSKGISKNAHQQAANSTTADGHF